MLQTLNTYPNLYSNPIVIPAYTIVEVYKDAITSANQLGYCIFPIKDKTKEELEQEIRTFVTNEKPTGYDDNNLAILGGHETNEYDYRIVYAVWYVNSPPDYPHTPTIIPPADPVEPFNKFNEIEINNAGSAQTDVTLTLSIVRTGMVEVKINEDIFKVNIKKLASNSNTIIIDKNGVLFNGKKYDNYDFSSTPTLKRGINTIGVTKEHISNLKIDYNPIY